MVEDVGEHAASRGALSEVFGLTGGLVGTCDVSIPQVSGNPAGRGRVSLVPSAFAHYKEESIWGKPRLYESVFITII